jgi:hypothetical protein
MTAIPPSETAEKLAELYAKPFGGKLNGRYRISPKMLRKIAGRKRLSEHFRQELGNEMFELGFVFLDMETYYAIASVRAFESYRRLGEGSFETVDDRKKSTAH